MADGPTFSAILANAKRKLAGASIKTPDLDARLLFEHVSGCNHAQLISKAGEVVPERARNAFDKAIARRIAGEPVHRITGEREFYGRRFFLSRETLVPRPDTETLVDQALSSVSTNQGMLRILDVGTGSGVIGLTLLAELENADLVAIDISGEALQTARVNAEHLCVEDRSTFLVSDMFQKVEGRFDLIVSNPPYIPTSDLNGLDKVVLDHDPALALDGGADGLDFYRILFSQAPKHMNDGAILLVEFGLGQTHALEQLAHSQGWHVDDVVKDLAGIDRVMKLALVA